MKIGEKIKKYRVAKGLSQKKLSEITGISQTYISKLELDKSEPAFAKILLLADALEISIDELKKCN